MSNIYFSVKIVLIFLFFQSGNHRICRASFFFRVLPKLSRFIGTSVFRDFITNLLEFSKMIKSSFTSSLFQASVSTDEDIEIPNLRVGNRSTQMKR
jgi:hypothetical protein